MTRAKKLKRAIRARAGKTGESYTAARRQLLKARVPEVPAANARLVATPVQTAAANVPAKGAVSAARVLERTGKSLDHWFAVLDAFGARERGHTAAARHLSLDEGVDGWYAQGITVAYERLHGLRAVNQRCDGKYEVSVSRTLPATVPRVVEAFRDLRHRALWLKAADAGIARAVESAVTTKGMTVKGEKAARMRFKGDGGLAVAIYVDAKPGQKATVVAQVMKLKDAAAVEEQRGLWGAALDSLRRHLTGA